MNIYKFLFICSLFVTVLCVFVIGCYRMDRSDTITLCRDTVFHTDTVVRHDTILVSYPRLVSVNVRDTVFLHDISGNSEMLYNEQKVYQDSNYTAWISGINATLDSIRTFSTHSFITQTVTERISVPCDGFFAGVGVVTNGERFSPSIGLNYTKKSFLYSADISVMDGKPLFMLGFKYKIK